MEGIFKQPLAGDYISLLVKTLFLNPDPPGSYAPNPINPHYIIKQRGSSSVPDTPANPILRDAKTLQVTDSWHAYQQERILHNMKEEYCAVLDAHSDLQYFSPLVLFV
jgi:Actin